MLPATGDEPTPEVLVHDPARRPDKLGRMCFCDVYSTGFDLAQMLGNRVEYVRTGDIMKFAPADAIDALIGTVNGGDKRLVLAYAELPCAMEPALHPVFADAMSRIVPLATAPGVYCMFLLPQAMNLAQHPHCVVQHCQVSPRGHHLHY